jgi:hypothetical protein
LSEPSSNNQTTTENQRGAQTPSAAPISAINTIENNPDAADERDRAAQANERNHTLLEKIAFIVAVLAAAGTAYQAWIAGDTEKRSLRAYVVIGATTPDPIVIGKIPKIRTTFQNVGQTPVYHGAWTSGVQVANAASEGIEQAMPCADVMNKQESRKWFFGKEIYPYQERGGKPFTDFELSSFNSGTQSVFFTGRFCYGDIFGKIHFTDFCMFWNITKGGLGAPAEYCHIGNKYGDD